MYVWGCLHSSPRNNKKVSKSIRDRKQGGETKKRRNGRKERKALERSLVMESLERFSRKPR